MSETPEERLARLRREVEAGWTPPAAETPTAAPSDAARGTAADAAAPGPDASTDPRGSAAAAAREVVQAMAAAPATDVAPTMATAAAADPSQELDPSVRLAAEPPPEPEQPAPVPPLPAPPAVARSDHGSLPPSGAGRARGTAAASEEGWSLTDALGGPSIGRWVGIGLVALGAYLLLAQVVPGISFTGSLVLAVAGIVLLWLHFDHRAGAWALYAGAVLAAVGALRVVGDLLPVRVEGETSLGIGIALLSIAYLRHSQAGGYGWQGVVGAAALGWGLIQLVLGWLPGSPGLLDLLLPVVLLGGGVVVLLRTMGGRAA